MMLRFAQMSAILDMFMQTPICGCNIVGQEMRIVFLCIGLLIGFGVYAFFDLRDDYSRSVDLAEASCTILVLSDPNIELAPADIDCKLIVDDDFLLTFEVSEKEGLYVDCLPGTAFFRREISFEKCNLYRR